MKLTLKTILATLLILMMLSACAITSTTPRPTIEATATVTLKQTNTPVHPPTATAIEAQTPNLPPVSTRPPENSTVKNFRLGTRISFNITQAQVDFINSHYDYVMTPFLTQEVREKIQGPQLILYRSIQGTWTNFGQFDWAHIDAHENMFCHHQGNRILTAWHSWLMNPNDMVDPDAPDALDHWINYYAVTASEQIYRYDYDGLFIDSASHKLSPSAVGGKMPDDYNVETWRQGRVASLAFIKSYLPDKSVIFNGLHSGGGAVESLANTDGGMWEVFAFEPSTGIYYGEKRWLNVIELIRNYSPDKTIVLVTKEQPNLIDDIQKRIFVTASYLLVSNQNVIFSMTDLDKLGEIQYYPEYDIKLGEALDDYVVNEQGLFVRRFENGMVLVNPNQSKTFAATPTGDYKRVIPVGGGCVPQDGNWEGSIMYETIGEAIELPPVSGVILINR